ncbi:NAD(P)/FAD-dependent oxidoreductase [Rhizorhabdus sp.]|uniref:phytoene desaturase family protein n=1 Tax=Rhizorhabdus sp. TaxID=1968843 RepID=UPI0019CE8180|nr:NAD(P)/FAD-dependent oxidoreductase [Rhizorhabdus sp.]MBD3759320.1 NAD(P)/FAD-dependent oxidoreductase [Rhizorhabdus sp.]
MNDRYDVVTIGSGHNGLIAAAYLARAGKRVLIVERNSILGGGVVTSEVAAPGFRHDWHSAVHVLIQANPLLVNDELGLLSEFGLKYICPEPIYSTVFDDGDYIVSFKDVEKTCASIAHISADDAEAYRLFAQQAAAMVPLMLQGMFVPPPPQGMFWSLLDQSPEGRGLMHIMQKSMLDIVNEHFSNEKTKIHLMRGAAELLVNPDEKGTGALLLNMVGLTHGSAWGIPEGGSGALVDALERCLTKLGAEFQTSVEVDKVLVSGGKATGIRLTTGETIAADVVIGQIHPWLLGEMVENIDPGLARRALATKASGYTLMSSMYALNQAPQLRVPPEAARTILTLFAPASLEAYLRLYDDIRYGDLPGALAVCAYDHAQWDPSRAPAGGGTLDVVSFCPFELRNGGASAWDEQKDDLQRQLHEIAVQICSNLDEPNIAGSAFHTPMDALRYSPTFQHGDVGGLAKFFFQIGGHRPTPELSQYAVPGAEGLYLAGAFMHPPGGVTGGGRATAIRICEDLGIDFDSLLGKAR